MMRPQLYSALMRTFNKSQQINTCRQCHTFAVGNSNIGVIGVPFYRGQPQPGVAQAPQKLRDAGILTKLEDMGYSIEDFGDIQFEQMLVDSPSNNVKYPRTVGSATKKIAEKVANIVSQDKVALSLGGDHSMTLGTLYGHAQVNRDLKVVWVDAHADINPPLASMSGNIHGMVLSFLIHELQDFVPKVPGLEWVKPIISAKDIAYIGLRDIDAAERYIIEKLGIACYTTHDIDRHGIDYVMEHAIEAVNPGLKCPMHVSYDIDSLDPTVSPSTGTPVPGGLSIREGMYVAEELALTGKVTAIDLVEVNPEMGTEREQELTLYTAVEVIAACFGKRRKGNTPPGYRIPVAAGSKSTGIIMS